MAVANKWEARFRDRTTGLPKTILIRGRTRRSRPVVTIDGRVVAEFVPPPRHVHEDIHQNCLVSWHDPVPLPRKLGLPQTYYVTVKPDVDMALIAIMCIAFESHITFKNNACG
jgi:hypothetical protein